MSLFELKKQVPESIKALHAEATADPSGWLEKVHSIKPFLILALRLAKLFTPDEVDMLIDQLIDLLQTV